MTDAPPSPGLRANLVMGVIENYSFEQLKPFLLSLRRTGYAGEIVLFHHRIDRETLEAIRRLKVILMPFHNVRGAFPEGIRRKLVNRLSRFYHWAKWPCYGAGWKLLLVAAKLRYLLYYRYLAEHGARYHRVLLTDTRDVLFQGDPLATGPAEDLVFFEESHPLDHGEFNGNWLRSQLGQSVFERLASRTTLCSGTIMGTPQALCCYLDRVLQLMKKAGHQDLRTGDQALHNAVVYEGLREIPYSIRICPNGTAQVYTLTQYLDTAGIRRAPGGEVIDPLGRPVPIVHQYDRHPGIRDALLKLYAR